MSTPSPVKRLAMAVAAVLCAPAVAAAWLESRAGRGEQVFRFFAELLALAPGLPGAYLRAAYYAGTLEAASRESHVGFGTVFVRRGASIGRHASLGCHCVIGDARIGAGAMIGSRVSVPSGRRQHLDAAGRLSSEDGRFDTVTIGAGCWIGEGAIVMADVGEGCIVAAGAVVSTPMPANSVIGGNPARVLRTADAADPLRPATPQDREEGPDA
jgi:virginiamycin A acetyltransferase